MQRLSLPPASKVEPFSQRWQDACRELVRLYCRLPSKLQANGEPMGMTAFRHEVMADFDVWDGKRRLEDRALGRQELEPWLRGETYLTAPKFQYIDRWMRLNHRRNVSLGIYEPVVAEKERSHQRLLHELYGINGDDFDDYQDDIDKILGRTFLSPIIDVPHASDAARYSRYSKLADYRQFCIHIRSVNGRSALVTAIYFDQPFSQLKPDISDKEWAVCFGHVNFSEVIIEGSVYRGVMHLFRGEFPGHDHGGTSVSSLWLQKEWDDPGDTLRTDWYPQVGSQRITNGEEMEGPRKADGKRHEFTLEQAGGQYPALTELVQNLTNKYLLW